MTFKNWYLYYESNQNHFSKMNWIEKKELTDSEIKMVTSSLQQFQRGENSEGKSLFKYAKGFNLDDYLKTIRLFIKEEQTHALVLGKFMELNGIEKIKGHWVDAVFRKLRKLASLENSVTVLVTAEIIAAVYYKALRDATDSVNLQNICRQILVDEEMHINFQSFTLQQFYNRKGKFGKWRARFLHRFLMSGTIVVVWWQHKKVLKPGGYRYRKFKKEVWQELDRMERMVGKKTGIEMRFIEKKEMVFS